jgi:hypothetical protein
LDESGNQTALSYPLAMGVSSILATEFSRDAFACRREILHATDVESENRPSAHSEFF